MICSQLQGGASKNDPYKWSFYNKNKWGKWGYSPIYRGYNSIYNYSRGPACKSFIDFIVSYGFMEQKTLAGSVCWCQRAGEFFVEKCCMYMAN